LVTIVPQILCSTRVIRHPTDRNAPRQTLTRTRTATKPESTDSTRQNVPGDKHAPPTYKPHYLPSVTCAKGGQGGSVRAVSHNGPRTLHCLCTHPAPLSRITRSGCAGFCRLSLGDKPTPRHPCTPSRCVVRRCVCVGRPRARNANG